MTELNMEEDSWIFIDEDSSCDSLADSDKIDSETEAELYSKIHHESNLTSTDSENLKEKPPGLLVFSPFMENASTPIGNVTKHLFPNQNFSNAKRKSSEMDADYKKSNKKLSPAKNRKSNAMCPNVNLNSGDLENTNDSQQFEMNNLQNKRTTFNSHTDKKSNNGSNTFLLDSSDSDNDIWIEPHSDDKNDFKINLLKNTDTIFFNSSDSENESDISSPLRKRDSILRNLSMPNIKADGNSKDLWHISYEDLNRSKKHSNRYHESFDITCSNCNRKGHTYKICPSPKVIRCFVCGGNHMGFRCSNRMCSNCHSSGHDRKNCWREVYKGFCHLCNMAGHAKGNCPDLWRRYHLSTTSKKLTKGKEIIQDTNLYCWNCGRGGHFGAVCPLSHPSKSTFNTWPCVISYTNPKYLLKSRLFYYGKISSLNQEKLNENSCNIASASSEIKHSQLNLNNELSVSSRFNEGKKGKRVKNKKLNRPDLRLNKAQGVVKERDFPRIPKNENPMNCSLNSTKLEGETIPPHLSIKKQVFKLKNKFNKLVKKSGLQSVTQDFDSKMLSEKSPVKSEYEVPEIIRRQVQKKFNKWRKRRIILLKRRELTKS